jgi:hypothetical protein
MARIAGAEPQDAGFLSGLLVRFVYWMTKKKLGRVVEPLRIVAHHTGLLWGYGQMEQSFAGSHTVEETLKSLAENRTATLVGCPF